MKIILIIIILSLPLSLFSQDEFSYFKSLCEFRKENKIKVIFFSTRNNADAYRVEYFDENGFPSKIDYPDCEFGCTSVENIQVNSKGLLSYIIIESNGKTDSSFYADVPPSVFLELGIGDNTDFSVQYKFDSGNRPTEIIINKQGSLFSLKKIFYDNNNRIQYTSLYDNFSNLKKTAYYFYGSDNMVKKILYSDYGELGGSETVYFEYGFH